jgi:hypothetical protein
VSYQFTNNSKTHKRGEICGSMIRKKSYNYCWKHQMSDKQLIPEDKKQNDLEFIQLENSSEKNPKNKI